jgi:CubicO group peptidase (beta-lactamase class C family)
MIQWLRCLGLVLGIHTTPLWYAQAAEWPTALQQSIDAHVNKRPGAVVVVGVLLEQGEPQYLVAGTLANGQKPTADTLFEIGSVTKVYTGLLLAQMVQKKQVQLTDPVSQHLPAEWKLPGEPPLTLLELATHTSGLPRVPPEWEPSHKPFLPPDDANPYAKYALDDLKASLGRAQLTNRGKYAYSNFATGLLGCALAHRAGVSYEMAVQREILQPLNLTDTHFQTEPEQKKRFAPGHDDDGKPTGNWDFRALAPAGALRSSVREQITFLTAACAPAESPLAASFTESLKPRHPTDSGNEKIALGWHLRNYGKQTLAWHNGGTGGYRSFIGVMPQRKVGIVVLCNSAQQGDTIDQIGMLTLPLIAKARAK